MSICLLILLLRYFFRSTNREPEFARTNYIGNRKQSHHQETERQNSMLDWKKKKGGDTTRNKSVLKDGGVATIDVTSYRGNLYKQTLSPNWSKSRLRDAQKKYNGVSVDKEDEKRASFDSPIFRKTHNEYGKSMDATMRDSFMDTRIGGPSSVVSTNRFISAKDQGRMFTKTVTNFA